MQIPGGGGGVLLCKGKKKVREAWDTSCGSLYQEPSADFSAGGCCGGERGGADRSQIVESSRPGWGMD